MQKICSKNGKGSKGMIEYFNEDCMVGMARYPDKHFELAIVDPPYGIGDRLTDGCTALHCLVAPRAGGVI